MGELLGTEYDIYYEDIIHHVISRSDNAFSGPGEGKRVAGIDRFIIKVKSLHISTVQ